MPEVAAVAAVPVEAAVLAVPVEAVVLAVPVEAVVLAVEMGTATVMQDPARVQDPALKLALARVLVPALKLAPARVQVRGPDQNPDMGPVMAKAMMVTARRMEQATDPEKPGNRGSGNRSAGAF